MSFWEFASKDFLAVCVILYFVWLVIDRLLEWLTEHVDKRRMSKIERRLQRLEDERKHRQDPWSWTYKTVTRTTEKPTQNEKEEPHE